ncbi:hypothetical protein ACEYYB_03985 [Paracoccus sp. p4-l81]
MGQFLKQIGHDRKDDPHPGGINQHGQQNEKTGAAIWGCHGILSGRQMWHEARRKGSGHKLARDVTARPPVLDKRARRGQSAAKPKDRP